MRLMTLSFFPSLRQVWGPGGAKEGLGKLSRSGSKSPFGHLFNPEEAEK